MSTISVTVELHRIPLCLDLVFQLVLEVETLIDDFLKEVGKSRYIITDDEFFSISNLRLHDSIDAFRFESLRDIFRTDRSLR